MIHVDIYVDLQQQGMSVVNGGPCHQGRLELTNVRPTLVAWGMQCCQTVRFFGQCPIFEGSSENRSEKGNVRKAAKMSDIITFLCRSPVLSLFSATEGTNHCTFASKKASACPWKCKVTCLDQAGWHVH